MRSLRSARPALAEWDQRHILCFIRQGPEWHKMRLLFRTGPAKYKHSLDYGRARPAFGELCGRGVAELRGRRAPIPDLYT